MRGADHHNERLFSYVLSISVQLGPTISVQTGPVPAVALDGHARFLMRQLSLPVSMMSQ
jgi:hypothetical protein